MYATVKQCDLLFLEISVKAEEFHVQYGKDQIKCNIFFY